MKKILDKNTYDCLIQCLEEVNMHNYAIKIKESLYIDNAFVDLGFESKPPYVVDINIKTKDIKNIIDYLETLHEIDYEQFDNYLEIYNMFKIILEDENEM